ncbi:MAG: tyrosine-type recombinase/integrase [Candidatus Acidiferrum sp.]
MEWVPVYHIKGWGIFNRHYGDFCTGADKTTQFGFHNFRHSLATFLVSRGKDVKTIQGLLRHAKSSTTLDLYTQSNDAAKLEAQEDIALAITSTAAAD